MDRNELVAELTNRARQLRVDDRFNIMQSIKDTARAIFAELELTLDEVLAGADDAYDVLIGPIDLPGPDAILDQFFKAALKYGIRQSWELLQKDT